jgi:hypothetical protein
VKELIGRPATLEAARSCPPPVVLTTDMHAEMQRLVEEKQLACAAAGELLTPEEAVAVLMVELRAYRATL